MTKNLLPKEVNCDAEDTEGILISAATRNTVQLFRVFKCLLKFSIRSKPDRKGVKCLCSNTESFTVALVISLGLFETICLRSRTECKTFTVRYSS